MRYARIEENAMDHPKFIALNAGAWRLWCEGNTYCQRQLTDGFIPATAVKGFRYYSAGAQKQLLEALVPNKGPLWERVDGGYQMHDYLDWNDSAEKVLAARKAGKDRLEKWRAEQQAKKQGVTPPPETHITTLRHTACDVASKRNGTEQVKEERHARSRGLMAGSSPVDHGLCLAHGPVCLKPYVAKNYIGRFGGDEAAMVAWAEKVCARWQIRVDRGEKPQADDFKFWATEYDADFAAAAVGQRSAPDVDSTADYLAKLRGARG